MHTSTEMDANDDDINVLQGNQEDFYRSLLNRVETFVRDDMSGYDGSHGTLVFSTRVEFTISLF
jgi:hypothetical protein